jgi:hypothetical protein
MIVLPSGDLYLGYSYLSLHSLPSPTSLLASNTPSVFFFIIFQGVKHKEVQVKTESSA